MKKHSKLLSYVIGIAIPLLIGGLSALLTMDSMEAYGNINQPPLSPPAILFPIAWTLLYSIMGIASILVYRSGDKRKNDALIYYGFQLVLNFFWPLIFFITKEYWFAFIWLIALLIAVIVTTVIFSKINRVASYLLTPYIIWLVFAAYLNLGVAILN